jgi:diaminopimelate epimerase
MLLRFTKMSGAGNDFVMMDNRHTAFRFSERTIAALCARGTGIGADGLILLENSSGYDFAMRYYNADGKLGSMCGNGGRCAAQFAHHCGINKTNLHFEANQNSYTAELLPDGRVKLKMQPPTDFRDAFHVGDYDAYFVDTGSPHAIVYVNDVETLDVFTDGKKIRQSKAHFPNGANVNFLQQKNETTFRIRTFERGVENETLACGTGCVAAAVMSYHVKKTASTRIHLIVQSGETIDVEFDAAFRDVYLIGSATMVFTGEIDVND